MNQTFKQKIEDQRAATKASAAAGRIDPRHARMILAALDHTKKEIEASGIYNDPAPDISTPDSFFS